MPVVVLDALNNGEARGSFLLDHTPRIPVRRGPDGHFDRAAIRRAIGLLADAWLHRVLWKRLQSRTTLSAAIHGFWWAPHAPEPSTLARWLPRVGSRSDSQSDELEPGTSGPCMLNLTPGAAVRILHPDPPLSQDERDVLQWIVSAAGYGALDLTTPRLLASRGA
jgi:hypothetical protein